MREPGVDLISFPLFAGLNQETLYSLKSMGRLHRGAGREVIGADVLGQRLFLLLKGRIKVVRSTSCGEEALQQCLLPGDIFCAAAMLNSKSCCSYAQCVGNCRYVTWAHRIFLRLMSSDMRLQSNLMHYLASQVEEERARRCLTQYMDVHTRIATYLLTQYDRSYRESQKAVVDIRPLILTAQELGVARETLSRTLTAFEQRGVLCSRRGLVHIRAPEVLRSIAEGEEGKHF